MVDPTPAVPEQRDIINKSSGTKAATPDLILFETSSLPIDLMTDLLFERIGGQEIINIARNDIINGQPVKYRLIGNSRLLDQEYSSQNIFKLPGGINEKFENFAIKFAPHVPESGTAPAPYYIGAENSFGCSGFPVLDKYSDAVIGCFASYETAQLEIDNNLAPYREIVYSDPNNGNIVVDVTRMKTNEQVEIEILSAGTPEDDTIY